MTPPMLRREGGRIKSVARGVEGVCVCVVVIEVYLFGSCVSN